MKFCMVTTFYPPYHFGGDAIYVYNLSNELAKLGHQVDVIHCYDAYRAISGEPHAEWPNHENVHVHTLRSPWKLLSPVLTHQTGRSGLKKKAIEKYSDKMILTSFTITIFLFWVASTSSLPVKRSNYSPSMNTG
jgi:hypothetical protein